MPIRTLRIWDELDINQKYLKQQDDYDYDDEVKPDDPIEPIDPIDEKDECELIPISKKCKNETYIPHHYHPEHNNHNSIPPPIHHEPSMVYKQFNSNSLIEWLYIK